MRVEEYNLARNYGQMLASQRILNQVWREERDRESGNVEKLDEILRLVQEVISNTHKEISQLNEESKRRALCVK